MGNEAGRAILAIVSSIVGLAIISVILSAQAQTGNIISTSGQALSSVIGAATAPVSGGAAASAGAITGSFLSGISGISGL
jgi:hypothetical protein